MELTVFVVVLISAVFHASWNFVARKVKGDLGVFFIAWLGMGILLTPLGLYYYDWNQPIFPAWWFLLGTGITHTAYILFLCNAYRIGDVSLVYPIARGTGIALTTLVNALALGESISHTGVVGIAGICLGVMLIGWKKKADAATTSSNSTTATATGHGMGVGASPSRQRAKKRGHGGVKFTPVASGEGVLDDGGRSRSCSSSNSDSDSDSGNGRREGAGPLATKEKRKGRTLVSSSPSPSPSPSPSSSSSNSSSSSSIGARVGGGGIIMANNQDLLIIDDPSVELGNLSISQMVTGEARGTGSNSNTEGDNAVDNVTSPAQIKRPHFLIPVGYALVVGVWISAYSVIDAHGTHLIHPVPFLWIMSLLMSVMALPYILRVYPGKITYAVKNYKGYSAFIGFASMGVYLAVLFAFSATEHASYIVALREFAVVIGAALGFIFLKEPFTWTKGAGIVVIMVGLVLVKIS